MGQSTGIVVIANFAPRLFAGLGFDNQLQLGLAVVWVSICAVGTWLSSLLIERIGRVKQLGKLRPAYTKMSDANVLITQSLAVIAARLVLSLRPSFKSTISEPQTNQG